MWKSRNLFQRYRPGHSLTKARGTSPGKLITWESNSHDFFLGRGKGICITPKLHLDLPKFAPCVVFSGSRPGSRLGTPIVCLMELRSPTAIAPFTPARSPSSNPAFQGPAIETRIAVSSVLVCWPRDPVLLIVTAPMPRSVPGQERGP